MLDGARYESYFGINLQHGSTIQVGFAYKVYLHHADLCYSIAFETFFLLACSFLTV
jgi:hypothetical protein